MKVDWAQTLNAAIEVMSKGTGTLITGGSDTEPG